MSSPAFQFDPLKADPEKVDATVLDSSQENATTNVEQPHQGIPATGPESNFSQELSRGVPLGGSFGGLRMPQSTRLNPGPLNPATNAQANTTLATQSYANPVKSEPQTTQASSSQDFYPTTTVPAEFLQQLAAQKAAPPEQAQETYPTNPAQPQLTPQQVPAAPAQTTTPDPNTPQGFTQHYSAAQPMPVEAIQNVASEEQRTIQAPEAVQALPHTKPLLEAPLNQAAALHSLSATQTQATAPEGATQPQAFPQHASVAQAQSPNPTDSSEKSLHHPAQPGIQMVQAQTGQTHPQASPQQIAIASTEVQAVAIKSSSNQALSVPREDASRPSKDTTTEKPVAEAKPATESTVPFTKANISKPQPKRIGDILIDEGYITGQQLAQALQEGKATNSPLGAVLIRMGYIDEVNLGKALAKLHGLQYIDTSNLEIDPEVMKLVPSDFIRRHMVVPYRMDHAHKRIEVIMARPDNLHILDEVALLTGYRPIPRVSTHNELVSLLDKYYRSRASTDDAMARIEEDFSKQDNQYDQGGITKELEAEMDADDAPVVQLVNSILIEALDSNASDIHIEPQKERLLIRFRIDGILREMHSIPKKMGAAFVSRVKVASGMDIAERRRPQDGRMRLKEGSQEVDMRVNTLATQFGEKIVIRLLRPNATTGGIEKLGLRSDEAKRIAKMVHAPHGIILVTGPTGSGKTTTLYSCLREINSPERNITTIEDPVEYPLSGVNQTQVSHKAGLTFSLCLRAILRQDPDVVMVGEIRDHETLEAAIHASLTGHLVFSTLHTNSASKTITRLLEMGAPNYLVSTAVIGILAQRLVRKVCNGCRVSYTSTEEEMGILNITEPATLQKGEGCDKCGKSGYSGRVGLYEIMTMNREVQELVAAGASTFQIQDAAVRNGMLTLGMDGKRKIYEGLTTVAEVTRVLGLDLDES